MKMLTVAIALVLVLSAAVLAHNLSIKVALHVEPHVSGRMCNFLFPTITACWHIWPTEPEPDVDVFPVFFDLDEYQGVQYALTWPGLYSASFTSCSELTVGDIVNPGDGVAHAWTECSHGSVVIPGWAWIFDYGRICMIPHPDADSINIGDCQTGCSCQMSMPISSAMS